MDNHPQPAPNQPLRVTLDGQPVTLPESSAESLAGIRAHLEYIAIENERVLWSLQVDGVKLNLAYATLPIHTFHHVAAETISFHELSTHLIASGKAKTDEILARIDQACLLVLINSWTTALELWKECQPVLREPLFALRALQQIKGVSLLDVQLDGVALAEHLEDLNRICCEFGLILSTHRPEDEAADLLSFSNLLERRLAPWLQRLSEYFARLHETTKP